MEKYRSKIINKFISVFLAIILIISNIQGYNNIFAQENTAKLTIKGTEYYNRAFEVLDGVNDYRQDEGLSILRMDENLINGAMIRAAECSIYMDIERPDGSDFFDAKEFNSVAYEYRDCNNVVISGQLGDYQGDYLVLNWMRQEYFKDKVLDSSMKSMGVGAFRQSNRIYYVIIFSKMPPKEAWNKEIVEVTRDIDTSEDKINLEINEKNLNLDVGVTIDLSIEQINQYCEYGAEFRAIIENSSFVWKSSNENVAKVSADGKVTAIGKGNTKIIATLSNNKSISCNITVANNGIDKVSNLRQISNSTSTIILSWDKVPGVSGYSIYKYNEDTKKYNYLGRNSSSSANVYKDKELSSATIYKYKVRAYKLEDGKRVYGEYSDEIEATTYPVKVKNVYAKEITSTTVSLDWTSVSRVSAYSIYRASTKDGEYKYIKTVSSSECKDINLSSNKTYYYKVKAFKMIDNKKYYGSSSDILTVRTKPSQITNLKLSSNSTSNITITWDKISGISGYEIYKYDNSTKKYTRLKRITSYSTTSYKDENLSSATTYKYKVRAYKTINGSNIYGDYSQILETSTDPVKVKNLYEKEVTTTSIYLDWNSVPRATKYIVYRSADKSSGYKKIATTTSSSFKDESVKSKTKYYYKVKAYKTLNEDNYYGSQSDILTVTTKTAKVSELEVEKYGSTYINLKWKDISNCDGYQIYRSTSKYGSYTRVKTLYKNKDNDYIEKDGYVSYKNSGLNSVKTYYYKVRGFNKSENSSNVYLNFSDIITTSTAPFKVKNLVDENYRTTSSLKIKWDKVSGASGYEIIRISKTDSVKIKVSSKATTYTDTNLKKGHLYTYKVRAYRYSKDSSGSSYKNYYGLYSDELSLRTEGPDSTLKVQDYNYPPNMEIGTYFNLKGNVYSNYNIRTVKINIVDLSNNEVKLTESIDIEEDTQKYSLSEIGKNIKFETLPAGKYKYILYAEDDFSIKALTLIEKEFEVIYPQIMHPLTSPKLTSSFTYYRSGFRYAHFACDYISLDGNYNIRAFANGIVERVNLYDTNPQTDSRGKFIIIKHKIKTSKGEKTVYSRYYHLSEIDSSIQVGASVKIGQKIGVMGNTGLGYGSDTWTNRHLHFAISTTSSDAEKVADPNQNIQNENYVSVTPDMYYDSINGEVTFYNPQKVFEIGSSIFDN